MSDAAALKPSWKDAALVYFRRDVLVVVFLGFASGLPLALSGSTLLIWMAEAKTDIKTLGLFALVGTPYTLKFLWAPVIDALSIPVLGRVLGRRRSWLLASQLLLMAAILYLATRDPALSPALVALGAVFVAFASATQDIVIDAYRVETLDTSEQAAGMGGYVAAYRVGMLVSTAGALYITEGFEKLAGLGKAEAWSASFMVMALLVAVGMVTTLVAREKVQPLPATVEDQSTQASVKRVFLTARDALADFLKRDLALAVLGFVIFFKFCDAFAGALIAPFIIDIGFQRVDYANYVKGVGLIASLLGGFAGGMIARALPLSASLWLAAILQMLSNLAFAGLALIGPQHWALASAIVVENFSGAIGTVIFVAYLSSQCRSIAHTATQFAVLTALAAVGRTYLSASAGFMQVQTGWTWFFILSCLTALPGFALLIWLQWRGHFADLPKPTGPLQAED